MIPFFAEIARFNTTYNDLTPVNTIGSSIGLGTLIGFILVIFFIILLIGLASSLERYQRFWKGLTFVISSLRFTAFGGIATGIVYCIYLIGTLIGSATGAIDPIWYAYGIGALIVFTVIGYAVEKIVKRIAGYHETTTGKPLMQELTPK